ncbi:MAG: hypothetical protein WC445_04720 [Patescibacteria group bacterium]
MIRCIVGAMWSGKTYMLLEEIDRAEKNGEKHIEFDHFANTRGSDRDLKVQKLEKKIDISKYDVVIFDEVHLYSAFGNENVLLETIATASPHATIICAGLLYDFYNDYIVFSIWKEIQELDHVVDFTLMPSRKPCENCGSLQDVNYTANDGSTTNRVGDHYVNVCKNCKDIYLEKYRKLCLEEE